MSKEDFAPIDSNWLEHAGKLWLTPWVGSESERIIVDPIMLSHAAYIYKKTPSFFYTNPDEAVRMVCGACELYDITPVGHFLYADYWGTDYGCELKIQENAPPGLVKKIIKTPEDVDNFTVLSPEELSKGPTFTSHFKALDTVLAEYPSMFAPITQLAGPVELSANWTAIEDLFMWMITEPDLVDKLCKKAGEHMVSACKATSERYGLNITITGSIVASGDLMDTEQIKRFSYQPLCKAVRNILNEDAGPGIYYHFCGNHKDDFELWKDIPMTPFTIVQFGYEGTKPFPAEKLVKTYGNRCACFGVVDTKTVDRGTSSQVYNEAKKQILAGKDSPRGFILGTCCECPTFAPPANVHALVKAARDFGAYKQ